VSLYRTVNPATGELLYEFPTLDDAEAEALLARAHEAFLSWRGTPIAERVRLFSCFAQIVESSIDELARLTTLEMGKLFTRSKGEAGVVAAMFRYYAENGEELLADEEATVAGFGRVVTRREPMGVVLGIEPWNGPLYQAMRATAPNLMLGNTVIVKPSEISAGSTTMFDRLFRKAGFPEGAYQTALVSTGQVTSYIADPRVRGVTLTGSDRAGAAVGEQAGRQIKPVVLELGGSDAFIVLESANVAKAADTAAEVRLRLAGQVCVSPKRIIMTEAIAGEFTDRFLAAFGKQSLGDPFDPETTVGPLSTDSAAAKLEEQYRDAIDKGATVLKPGGRVPGPGSFFEPAVITDITPEMRVFSEEVFGPLGMLYRVTDADSAVVLANGSPYGLSATVFAEDLDEATRVAEQLDTGSVGINRFLGAPIEIPFGGTKRSGVGRELGRSGMDQFANIKTYGVA
jgi:succinate-semialdehyde dehydrogenase/glutarate-semialdehyde dehydrogenase